MYLFTYILRKKGRWLHNFQKIFLHKKSGFAAASLLLGFLLFLDLGLQMDRQHSQ